MPHSHVYDKLKSAVHQISLILSSCLIKLFHLTHSLSPLSYCRSDKYIFLNILNFPIFLHETTFLLFLPPLPPHPLFHHPENNNLAVPDLLLFYPYNLCDIVRLVLFPDNTYRPCPIEYFPKMSLPS